MGTAYLPTTTAHECHVNIVIGDAILTMRIADIKLKRYETGSGGYIFIGDGWWRITIEQYEAIRALINKIRPILVLEVSE